MSENIYTKLGFKQVSELIYSDKIINEAKIIFSHLPKIVSIRPLIIEQAILEETLAISTAEDSKLTLKTAKNIQISEEQEARIIKYKKDKSLSDSEKYDQLEFENVRAVESRINSLGFKELNVDFICNLHHDLTIGLDGYHKETGLSYYHSGKLRQSNSTKVGKIRQYIPPNYTEIKKLLGILFKEFSNRKIIQLYDILEFHILFYAIHPFQNGNKRVTRILESILLDRYGFSAEHTISLSIYYSAEKNASNLFLMESLLRRDVTPFINFGMRGYFYAGNRLFYKTLELHLEEFSRNFNNYIGEHIKPLHLKNYKNTTKAIVELRGVFTRTEFIEQMKKYNCTLGVSQNIIQDLIKRKVLQKKENLYYFDKTLDIHKSLEELTAFLLQHNISLSN